VFYVLAKVLWALLQPSSLMLGAVIAGAVLLATRWQRLARALLWGGIAALLIGGLSPLGDALSGPLEYRFEAPDLERAGPPVAGIIVLGGGTDLQVPGTQQVAGLNEAAERYTEAVALARRLPAARLILSGGSGGLVAGDASTSEAATAGRLLEALGMARDRITLETGSRDTYENAVLTARILKPRPDQRWLLVTSAWHMPRAIGCFRKAGFTVEAWPVDYRSPRRLDAMRINGSISDGLKRLDLIGKEYVGLAVYYLRGRTDALLPGPGNGQRPPGPGA
jgi:uncharacterized SAM-binding protein YcdF (DUF218 family)